LGLAVAQKIVQDHGGEIVVEKTSATGTTFKVTIPLHSEDVSLPAARGPGKPVGAGAKPAASA
jgi:K+-sensing histidine kinase KdpD